MKYDLLSRFRGDLPINDRPIALIMEVLDRVGLGVCLVLLWKLSVAKLLPTHPGSSRVSTGSVRQEPAVTGTPVKIPTGKTTVLFTVKPAASRRFTVSPALLIKNIKKNKKRIVVEEEEAAAVAVDSEVSAMLPNTALQCQWHLQRMQWHLLRMPMSFATNANGACDECNSTCLTKPWREARKGISPRLHVSVESGFRLTLVTELCRCAMKNISHQHII